MNSVLEKALVAQFRMRLDEYKERFVLLEQRLNQALLSQVVVGISEIIDANGKPIRVSF